MAATHRALDGRPKCAVGGCEDPNHAKGYCSRHYTAHRRHGDPMRAVGLRQAREPHCMVQGCDRLHASGGYCAAHYQRFRKTGSPGAAKIATVRLVCNVDGCPKPRHAQGLCGAHYYRLRARGSPEGAGLLVAPKTGRCLVSGCIRDQKAKGLCSTHYSRRRITGDVGTHRPIHAYDARAWFAEHKYYQSDECLIWTADGRRSLTVSVAVVGEASGHEGQGKINVGRAMCIIAHGKPPTSAHVAAHWCGNGHLGCVNPRHLRWATQRENMADRFLHGVRTNANAPHANEAQIRAIETLAETMTAEEIAAAFRVETKTIEHLLTGRRKHL